MWGGLIFAAKCGEKSLIVLMNFSLKLAAKLQKNILFKLEEHSIYSARKNTHTHTTTSLPQLQYLRVNGKQATSKPDINKNNQTATQECNKAPRNTQVSRTKAKKPM